MLGGDLWWLVDAQDDSSIAPCLRMVMLHKEAEPEPKINKELSQLTTGMLITTQNYQNASRNSIGQIDSRFDGSH